ncbi:hypothetical protein GQ600_3396 [Phytophthora cactorum]|nr:hypothetical protein GQ600_3396 [Phytophthora cactorum]
MKKWKTVKSQLMSCTSCSSGAPHSMRYRLLRRACKHCADAVPYLHCAWRLKVLVCQEADTVDMHELGDHHSRARTPSNSFITPRQRDFIKELTRENLMPMQIRHALGRNLRTVQNVVHHFRRTRLGGNDKRKAIMEAVRASAFSGREGDHDAFTFTSAYDGLRRHGLLSENLLIRFSIDFLLGDADPELVHVRAVPPMRTFVPELNRTREDMAISAQFGVHYARMEVEGQPRTGWPQSRSVVDESGEEILVNRKRVQNVGRPQNIGHALQRL